ncbi:hypothetical protein [Lutimonas sp.]|jgi:hypothetical protein|uniref:hypothetical protein n=1 Tax=Lutimonas sp. TaxID=1872403 RepID=UPI003C74A0AE
MSHHPGLKNHQVILYVDTDKITEGTEEDHCWLEKPYNKKPNPDFYTEVHQGESITWLGFSISNPNTIVNIKSIHHEKESYVFGKATLYGNGKMPETVIGTVINHTKGEKEVYIINFTIYDQNNGGERNGKFRVDPKLKIDTQGQ